MNFRCYLLDKIITICFLMIGALFVCCFLLFISVPPVLIVTFLILFFLLVICWLVCSYIAAKRRLRKLMELINSLDKPYLLGEMLPKPYHLYEQQYYEVMKTISHAAITAVEQATQEKNEYLHYVEHWIHEIKSPLTACTLLLENGKDPYKIKQQLKYADNLTERILYYARLRAPTYDLQIQNISIADCIHEAVQNQMELLIAAKIRVEVTGDFLVYSDPKSICFMISQFLTNCAQYCPECMITIHAENGTVTVTDNGIGIPSYELKRVTECGYVGSNGRRFGKSTGMGLFLVKRLCERLNIRFSIDSIQGEFTSIQLSFLSLTKM